MDYTYSPLCGFLSSTDSLSSVTSSRAPNQESDQAVVNMLVSYPPQWPSMTPSDPDPADLLFSEIDWPGKSYFPYQHLLTAPINGNQGNTTSAHFQSYPLAFPNVPLVPVSGPARTAIVNGGMALPTGNQALPPPKKQKPERIRFLRLTGLRTKTAQANRARGRSKETMKCPYCKFVTESKWLFKRHLACYKHQPREARDHSPHECDICRKKYSRKDSVSRHRKRKHHSPKH